MYLTADERVKLCNRICFSYIFNLTALSLGVKGVDGRTISLGRGFEISGCGRRVKGKHVLPSNVQRGSFGNSMRGK